MQKLTTEQAIVLSGFTGVLCVNDFSLLHIDINKRLGRPVYTHEMPDIINEIKEAYRADFMAMLP